VKLLSALMERAGSSLLPHDLSRMLGRSVALKGCAMAPRQAGFGTDRDAAAKQVAVIPLWQNGHRQQNSD
jgi:hypothetical protein